MTRRLLSFFAVLTFLLSFSCFAAADTSSGNGLTINTDNALIRRDLLQKYRFDDSVGQLLFVSHTSGWEARVWFYEKQVRNSAWSLSFESVAVIGKNGMSKEKEGDSKTPCGDFAVTGAFGILPDPGTALEYTDITPTTFACDEDCEYYNMIIDTAATGHDCKGEAMFMCSPEYNYGMTLSFNTGNEGGAGSAIFVHCKGQKPFTGGCIALSENEMQTVLKAAEPGMRIYLDEYYE